MILEAGDGPSASKSKGRSYRRAANYSNNCLPKTVCQYPSPRDRFFMQGQERRGGDKEKRKQHLALEEGGWSMVARRRGDARECACRRTT